MERKANYSTLLLSAFTAALFIAGPSLAKAAPTLTIEERQDQLMSNINQSQQVGELTVKEARKLRGELGDLAHKKAQIKLKKNTTKISDDDRLKFEAQLNKVSVELTKLKLDKRVHPEVKDKVKEAKASEKAKAEAKAEAKPKAKVVPGAKTKTEVDASSTSKSTSTPKSK